MNYKQLTNTLIDNYYDAFGVANCIRYLFDLGYTEQEIEILGFDTEDISSAKSEQGSQTENET